MPLLLLAGIPIGWYVKGLFTGDANASTGTTKGDVLLYGGIGLGALYIYAKYLRK